jgi:DNA-binding NarL/FixJ family response regulator
VLDPEPSPPDQPDVVDAPVPVQRAVIVDDDSRSANHFRETLDRMAVQVSMARSVGEAALLAADEPPHLLVVTLPSRDPVPGLDLAIALRARAGTACVFVLDRVDQAGLRRAAEAGADGVLCKPVHREQLEATFRLAFERQRGRLRSAASETASGPQRPLEDALHRIAQVLQHAGIMPAAEPSAPAGIQDLRPREQEVVRLLVQHLRVPAIARRLGISQQTVRNHLKSVFRRTGTQSQQELLNRLREHGLLQTLESQPIGPAASAGFELFVGGTGMPASDDDAPV